jgi:hypothetical protein
LSVRLADAFRWAREFSPPFLSKKKRLADPVEGRVRPGRIGKAVVRWRRVDRRLAERDLRQTLPLGDRQTGDVAAADRGVGEMQRPIRQSENLTDRGSPKLARPCAAWIR